MRTNKVVCALVSTYVVDVQSKDKKDEKDIMAQSDETEVGRSLEISQVTFNYLYILLFFSFLFFFFFIHPLTLRLL